MVTGQNGVSGHHAVLLVAAEYSLEREHVPIHHRPTTESDVLEITQRIGSAI